MTKDSGAAKVMTYNIDEGTDFQEAIAALFSGNQDDFLAAVQLTIDNVRATNPPARMEAIAKEIATLGPDLVGLQEVTQWRTGACSDSDTPEIDFLQLLLDKLVAQHQKYVVVATVKEFDFSGFTPTFTCVRASDSDVILARTDHDVQLSNIQTANFQNILSFNTPLGPVTVLRGWAQVDAVVRGQALRFITTHLEDGSQGDGFLLIQEAQAGELLQGPANTSMPVVLAGDFNSSANNPGDPTYATYSEILAGGLVDVWPVANHDAGLTCCQDPLLLNPASLLSNRIDLVFERGSFRIRG